MLPGYHPMPGVERSSKAVKGEGELHFDETLEFTGELLSPLARAHPPLDITLAALGRGAGVHRRPPLPGNHPMLPGYHPMLPGDHPMLPGDHPMLPGDRPMLPGYHPMAGVLSKLLPQGLRLKLTERNTFSKDEAHTLPDYHPIAHRAQHLSMDEVNMHAYACTCRGAGGEQIYR